MGSLFIIFNAKFIALVNIRGDKAKEWAKKASKAKLAIKAARHFMEMSSNVSDEDVATAESLIEEIEAALAENNNTRAASRGKKLGKLF